MLRERNDIGVVPRACAGKIFLHAIAVDSQLGGGLFASEAGIQAGDHGEILRPARSCGNIERNPKLNARRKGENGGHFFCVRKRKSARHHTDDGVTGAIERDRPPQNFWIGSEAVAPELVAENHFKFAARLVFFRSERASEGGNHAQRREKSGGSAESIQADRFTRAREIEKVALERGQGLERF